MIYVLLLFYIVILVFRYDIQNTREGRETNFRILWAVFVLIAGLSYHVGGDSIGYEIVFNDYRRVKSFSDMYDGNLLENSKEPFWVLLNIFFSRVFGDFQFLKFAIALFFNSTVFWFIKKHSQRPFFSIMLYAVMMGLHLNFQVLRESVAISFFLIAFDKLLGENRNYLQYYLFVIVAFLFHRFAFAMLVVPLFFLINMKWWYYVVLAAFLFAGPKVNELMINSGLFLLDDSISTSFEKYLSSDEYQIENLSIFGILHTILKIIPYWMFLFFSEDTKFRRIGCAYLLIYVFNAVSVGIFYRINDYLLFPFVVAAASSLQKISTSPMSLRLLGIQLSPMLYHLIVVVFVLVTLSVHVRDERFFEYYPYSSVITKETYKERENLLYYLR